MRTILQRPLSLNSVGSMMSRGANRTPLMRSKPDHQSSCTSRGYSAPRQVASPLQQKHQQLMLSRRRRRYAHDRSAAGSVAPTKATTTGASASAAEAAAAAEAGAANGPVEAPSLAALRMVAFTTGIPFVGFGIMDNALLIVAGDAIDTSLGVLLGISTLCAAAIGNIISDLAGIGLGTAIDDFCTNTLRLPVAQLSTAQRQLRSVRLASQAGMAIGMTLGCVIGMFPLLLIDTNKTAKLRKRAQVETLFRDVATEAKELVGAESTCLYLRVECDDGDAGSGHGQTDVRKKKKSGVAILPYKPSANGGYLYAMYYAEPRSSSQPSNDRTVILGGHKPGAADTSSAKASSSDNHVLPSQSRIILVGRGIVSRALLTGDTWNITKVMKEPDFFPAFPPGADAFPGHHQKHHHRRPNKEDYRNLVVVPILDGHGRAIAVLEALNKKGGDEGFSDQDVEILKSLASHISVSLQVLYQDAATTDDGDNNVRLRDTIRILKEMGIQGIAATEGGAAAGGRRWSSGPTLFPSTSTSPSSIRRSKTSQLFPAEA